MSFRGGCTGTMGVIFAIVVVIPGCIALAFFGLTYVAVEQQHAEMVERRGQEQAPQPVQQAGDRPRDARPVDAPPDDQPNKWQLDQEGRKNARRKFAEQQRRDDAAIAAREAEAAKQGAIENAAQNEQLAAAKLRAAQSLLKAGKRDSYQTTLEDLVKKYPNTKAATEARKALR